MFSKLITILDGDARLSEEMGLELGQVDGDGQRLKEGKCV